jgi:hypothetical protein
LGSSDRFGEFTIVLVALRTGKAQVHERGVEQKILK